MSSYPSYQPYNQDEGSHCRRCGAPLFPMEASCRQCGYPVLQGDTFTAQTQSTGQSWSGFRPQTGLLQYGYDGQPGQQPQTSLGSAKANETHLQNQFLPLPSTGEPTRSDSFPPFASTKWQHPDTSQPSNSVPFQPPMQTKFEDVPNVPSTGMRSGEYFKAFSKGMINANSSNNYYIAPQEAANANGAYNASFNTLSPQASPSLNAQPITPPPYSQFQPRKTSGTADDGGNRGGTPGASFSRKRSPSTGLIVGAILLVILLVAGGVTAYLLILQKGSSTQNGGSAPSAAPTAPPNVSPLFADTFDTNQNGWNLQGEQGKFSVAVGNGAMTLEDDNNRLLWELLPSNKIFSNFTLAVDATLSKGSQDNGYGVYIRGTANQNSDFATYYRFEIYGDGTYAIFKGATDANGASTSTRLVDYTVSPAIQKQGKVNHIVVKAVGSTLTLVVNGQQLSKVTDTAYNSGSIALFVSNLQNAPAGAQAKFSQLTIYPA